MGEITPFHYCGPLQSSKSLMNRALIVQSYFPEIQIHGASHCDDVRYMAKSCGQIIDGLHMANSFDVGQGGTTFRFLLARLSRFTGTFRVHGHPRLFQRPHQPLIEALTQLGCEFRLESERIIVHAKGWSLPGELRLDGEVSSQFASSLLLNAWGLEKDLIIRLQKVQASRSYLTMTLRFLRSLGMEIFEDEQKLVVPAGQTLSKTDIFMEPDMSSCFTLACFGALLGSLEVTGFPENSLQPDFGFLEIFKSMGIAWDHEQGTLKILKSPKFSGGRWDLGQTPDLFPVLAVFLTQARSPSELSGLETLKHKESHRIQQTAKVLEAMGAEHHFDGQNFHISGTHSPGPADIVPIDADSDHRIAMAITLATHLGYPLKLLKRDVVKKSFPNFFEILEGL